MTLPYSLKKAVLFITFYFCLLALGGAHVYAEEKIEIPSTQEKAVKKAEEERRAITKKLEKRRKRREKNSLISVLVLDLDGDGIELTGLASGSAVYWDIDADGFSEASAWVSSSDGILALDINGDNVINDHRELFGDSHLNGFSVLSEYDSDQDGYITPADKVWKELLIWVDKNSDATSQAKELFSVNESNITRFYLKSRQVEQVIKDSRVTDIGKYEINYSGIDGQNLKERGIASINLAYSDMNTVKKGMLILDYRASYLPNLRGYGVLSDLNVAASKDNDGAESLLGRLQTLSVPFNELFDPEKDLEQEVHEILFRWAQVQGIDPKSRGPHIDARKLAFLEMSTGSPFVQTGANNVTDPLFFGAKSLRESYHIAYNNAFARLISQTPGKQIFRGTPQYSIRTDTIDGIEGLNYDAITLVKELVGSSPDYNKRRAVWRGVVRIIKYTIGFKDLSKEDLKFLSDAIKSSLQDESLQSIFQQVVIPEPPGSYYPYILTDRLYKYFGIRLDSMWNWPIIGGVFLILFIVFRNADRKRRNNTAT